MIRDQTGGELQRLAKPLGDRVSRGDWPSHAETATSLVFKVEHARMLGRRDEGPPVCVRAVMRRLLWRLGTRGSHAALYVTAVDDAVQGREYIGRRRRFFCFGEGTRARGSRLLCCAASLVVRAAS